MFTSPNEWRRAHLLCYKEAQPFCRVRDLLSATRCRALFNWVQFLLLRLRLFYNLRFVLFDSFWKYLQHESINSCPFFVSLLLDKANLCVGCVPARLFYWQPTHVLFLVYDVTWSVTTPYMVQLVLLHLRAFSLDMWPSSRCSVSGHSTWAGVVLCCAMLCC